MALEDEVLFKKGSVNCDSMTQSKDLMMLPYKLDTHPSIDSTPSIYLSLVETLRNEDVTKNIQVPSK